MSPRERTAQIYLDNAATTRCDPLVVSAMLPYLEERIGNASSLHRQGLESAKGIEGARAVVAERIHADPEEILFTSGGTESNNLALIGGALGNAGRGRHVVTSAAEHSSVLNVCAHLEREGFSVTCLPVDSCGFVDPGQFARALRADTVLASIHHGNNEIGTVQPIEALGELCAARGILFHTDACQSFTRAALDVRAQRLDLVSLNAHKLHGPKGVGALFVRRGVSLAPLMHGGGQERALRPGTHNTPGIVGFGKAVEIALLDDAARIGGLRDLLIGEIERRLPRARLNGPRTERLCNNVNFTFRGLSGKSLLIALDRENIIVSSGSACSARSLEPSHVLLAIGLSEEDAHGAIRVSLSRWTTAEEIHRLVEALEEIVAGERGSASREGG